MLGVRRHADTWLSTGLLAGIVATTTMTLSYALERRVRRQADGPLD